MKPTIEEKKLMARALENYEPTALYFKVREGQAAFELLQKLAQDLEGAKQEEPQEETKENYEYGEPEENLKKYRKDKKGRVIEQ